MEAQLVAKTQELFSFLLIIASFICPARTSVPLTSWGNSFQTVRFALLCISNVQSCPGFSLNHDKSKMQDLGWLRRVVSTFLIQGDAMIIARAFISLEEILEGIATEITEGTQISSCLAWL